MVFNFKGILDNSNYLLKMQQDFINIWLQRSNKTKLGSKNVYVFPLRNS